ncbi:nucleotide-diphospho-sugar transferase [Chytriomyces sp. MP71]|nr:nucleotide-diphospho-sugar transferase [Chytriomyces sp. MP71]
MGEEMLKKTAWTDAALIGSKLRTGRHLVALLGFTALVSLVFNVFVFVSNGDASHATHVSADAFQGTPPTEQPRLVYKEKKPQLDAIPHVIHQSWKCHNVPFELFKDWHESWLQHNPSFTYILWNDTQNEHLIRTHYPWFLPKYLSYDRMITRADAARVFYMHKYGGIYADLDVVALKSLEPLLQGRDLVLGRMQVPGPESWEHAHSIPNAWMASKPGHSFWMYAADLMMQGDAQGTEEKAGPVMIWNAVRKYMENPDASQLDDLYLADPELIYPYSWSFAMTDESVHQVCSKKRDSFNEKACLELVDPQKKAYAISFWSHTWD